MSKLTKRIRIVTNLAFIHLVWAAIFLLSMLVTIPLLYGVNFLMPSAEFQNASNIEIVYDAATLSAITIILILFHLSFFNNEEHWVLVASACLSLCIFRWLI